MKADPDRPARGIIIEAKLDKGRGPVATVLIQEGRCARATPSPPKRSTGACAPMINDQGQRVKERRPLHARGGHRLLQRPAGRLRIHRRRGREEGQDISEYWVRKEREKELAASSKITLEAALPAGSRKAPRSST